MFSLLRIALTTLISKASQQLARLAAPSTRPPGRAKHVKGEHMQRHHAHRAVVSEIKATTSPTLRQAKTNDRSHAQLDSLSPVDLGKGDARGALHADLARFDGSRRPVKDHVAVLQKPC